SKMERGTDTGSQTLIDATVAMAASSRLAYLVSYFANPGGGWQGALIKYNIGVSRSCGVGAFHAKVGPPPTFQLTGPRGLGAPSAGRTGGSGFQPSGGVIFGPKAEGLRGGKIGFHPGPTLAPTFPP